MVRPKPHRRHSPQVLAAPVALELPAAKISNPQALHLLQKLLVKKPKERASIDQALKHAFITGGLDTQEVQGSFAMLYESQQQFKDTLATLHDDDAAAASPPAPSAPVGRGPALRQAQSRMPPPPRGVQFG